MVVSLLGAIFIYSRKCEGSHIGLGGGKVITLTCLVYRHIHTLKYLVPKRCIHPGSSLPCSTHAQPSHSRPRPFRSHGYRGR